MLELKVKTGKTGWLGDILVSLSLANLILAKTWLELIYSEPDYFLPTVTWHNWLSAAVLLFLFAILFILTLRLFRATDKFLWRLIILLPFGGSLLIIFDEIRVIHNKFPVAEILSWATDHYLWTILIISAIFFLLFLFRKYLISMVYIFLLIFSPFALLNLFYIAINTPPLLINPPYLHQKTHLENSITTAPKTIYIIFDELDYRIFIKGYAEKMESINLKNFEHIKQNALFFKNVKNMWDFTAQAIPSITIGKNVEIRPFASPFPDIELTYPNKKKALWSESDTIFNKLKNNNQNIAIIGWYHRYCEIFNHVTSYCLSSEKPNSLTEHLKKLMRSIIPYYRAINTIYRHQRIEKSTLAALSSSAIDFIYIHDSIPHPPSIWDAELMKYYMNILLKISDDRIKLYLNNVQLVDDFLGRIMNHMKEKGIWDTSTIIIGSDHRWRKPPDKRLENIPLLIKFPLQKTAYAYDRQVLPTEIKAMIEQIAVHKVHDPMAFMQWLDQQPREPLPTHRGDALQ